MAATQTTNAVLAMVVVVVCTGSKPALAAVLVESAVVVHVTNSAGVAVGDLAAAEQLAGQVYARIGVEMMWTDTDAAAALTEGAVHLDVLLLTEAMSALRQPHEQVLGSARADARRAWLYTGRIDKHALLTHANPIRVLAVVLAHELGHLLLPEYHHARTGLMRAAWEGRIVKIPDFLPAEARAIQASCLRLQSINASQASGTWRVVGSRGRVPGPTSLSVEMTAAFVCSDSQPAL